MCDPIAEIGTLIGDIGKVITKTFDWVINKVIDPVMTTVSSVIQAALDNPAKTIAQIAAVVTGNAWALPLISGADVAAKGGNLEDVLKATAVAYVSQEIGSYVGGNATSAVAKATDKALAGQIFGSGAGAAAVAIVSGQDPLKAFITGGVGAATGAVLGKVEQMTGGTLSTLPPTVQAAIKSAVVAAITNDPNPTAAIMGGIISASGVVTNAIKSFDPDGTKLDNTQRTILTDVLMGTATAALSGGKATGAIEAALMKAGSKALGDMATGSFKTATAAATTAFTAANTSASKVDTNIEAQKSAALNYNTTADVIKSRIAEQNRLSGVYNDAVKAHNANPTQATSDAANAAIAKYNEYVTAVNKEYAEKLQPSLTTYGAELDKLKQENAVLVGDYEKTMQAFGTKTDALSDVLDPIYRTSNRAFVEVMDENFNAEQYRKLNGLETGVDPYEHYLSTGQFQNAPTNDKAAESVVALQRTRLVTSVLEQKGVTLATADPVLVSKILSSINLAYGNNAAVLKGASIQDIINNNIVSIDQLVSDQDRKVFHVNVSGVSYGEWKPPPNFTAPAGMKLASLAAFDGNRAVLVYDPATKNPVWVEPDPSTAVAAWNPATGNYEKPGANINGDPTAFGILDRFFSGSTGLAPTAQDKILTYAQLGGEAAVNGVVSQAIIDASKTVVGWAKESGNSTLINTTANVLKAGGGFLESINGISVLMGAAPKTTALGKFSNALQDLGKASNTAEYQAAVKNMQTTIGNAKGVGGTLKAIYGAFESAPLQFLAEYVGVEGIQEVAPLLIGGVVASGAKGAALALKYGQAVAAKMGTAAGMTASIMTDIVESAGGAGSGAYDEAYKVAIKTGKTPEQADKIAMEIAQRQAFVAAATTAVSMGIGGAALEKAVLGRAGTGLGEAMQSLGDFAKTGTKIAIKEGFSEGGEEGLTQAALEGQLYKLDRTRDVAKEITQAVAFGMIAGGPIAGGAYGASRTGDVISNAMQGNPMVADILETNKDNPAAAATALANFGITDNTTKSNLMNTIDNANYTSSNEAAVALGKRSDFVYSDADVTELTGQGTDPTLDDRIEAYVDPRVFDIEEVKAAALAEGYALTDEEASKLVAQKDEAAATAAARAEFDPKATTADEAKGFLTSQGYTPTADEIKQFVGSTAESKTQTDVAAYVNPRQVTTEEAKKYLTDLGYTPTADEIKKFVGQVNEAGQAEAIGAYVDPRMVDEGEVKAAYEALGLKKPTAADVKKLIGQYDESGLTTKATDYLPTARYNSLVEQLEAMTVGATPEAIKAIELVRKDLTKSIANTGLEVAKLDLKIDTAKADLEKAINTATSGLATPADVDKAIANIKFPAGISKEDVSAAIKTYMEANPGLSLADVASKVADATKGLATSEGVKTDIAAAIKGLATTKDIETAISNIKFPAGITKEDVAAEIKTYMEANPGLSLADVASKIGEATKGLATTEGVKTEIAAALKTTEGRFDTIDKAIQDLRDAGLTADDVKATVNKIVGSAGTDTAVATGIYAHIDGVNTKIDNINTLIGAPAEGDVAATGLYAKIAAYEAAGMKRDEATQKAIADVATELGTTKADLLKELGITEGNLTRKIEGLETALTTTEKNILDKIKEYEDAGKTRDEATELAIAAVATELGTTKADLLTALGTTETTLNTKIADLQTQVATDIKAVETNLLAKIAANEKAGLTRDEATQKAVADLAVELGTTKEGLLTKIGTTETNLNTKIADLQAQVTGVSTDLQTKYDALTAEQKVIANQLTKQGIDLTTAIATAKGEVQTQIGNLQTVVGRDTQQASQSDLDAVIKMLETQGAYDAQYDYNGDKVIDQKDKIAIETYLKTQQPAYKPDPNDPFKYDPAAGSKWARTGVFKTIADEAEATRQAQADEAEKTRQRADALAKAGAAQAVKTQRMGNLNTLTSMLGQAGDTGGQQVTVKAADPAKIGYVYDFNSIFANPAQQNMFVSPYAEGGLVDGSEDVNDELLKILKG